MLDEDLTFSFFDELIGTDWDWALAEFLPCLLFIDWRLDCIVLLGTGWIVRRTRWGIGLGGYFACTWFRVVGSYLVVIIRTFCALGSLTKIWTHEFAGRFVRMMYLNGWDSNVQLGGVILWSLVVLGFGVSLSFAWLAKLKNRNLLSWR